MKRPRIFDSVAYWVPRVTSVGCSEGKVTSAYNDASFRIEKMKVKKRFVSTVADKPLRLFQCNSIFAGFGIFEHQSRSYVAVKLLFPGLPTVLAGQYDSGMTSRPATLGVDKVDARKCNAHRYLGLVPISATGVGPNNDASLPHRDQAITRSGSGHKHHLLRMSTDKCRTL
ncbi:hypothetical protein PMI26_05698 [Pseudomonas sp. GM33]|nr:hypothetical protein PMI26_05698 [Pseudomonas sp. GM33]